MRRLAKVKFEGRKKLDYRVDEAYKSLRTNVQFSGSGVQVIDFTSCTPNEGKSSVAFNLAVSFAESGKRVIMIDADMRKSVLAGRYKVGSVDAGLAHYLSGQKTLDEVCLNTDIDGMDIIFSGPFVPNPAELLESTHFHDLIKYCICTRGKYSASGSQTMMSSSVMRKALVISRFAEKLLPEPGVPRIRPFGFLSCLRSTMIMLLESAFSP